MAELRVKKEHEGSMDSKYYFSASQIGATTSPQVANQIGELNSRLNQGLKAVELGSMNQRLLDQVPKEHFKEVHRMAKLTGAEPSLHAPIQDLDLAGFGEKGWDPAQQEKSINQLKSVIERAHLMDPTGNTPITVHAGGMPVNKWKKDWTDEDLRDEKGNVAKDRKSEMALINPHTGEVSGARYRKRHRISGEVDHWTPEKYMNNMNRTSWDSEKFKLLQMKKEMDEQDNMTNAKLRQYDVENLSMEKEAGIISKEGKAKLNLAMQEQQDNFNFKEEVYMNMRSAVEDMYERFEKYPDIDKNGKLSTNYQNYKDHEYPKFRESFKEGDEAIAKKEEEYHKRHLDHVKDMTDENKKKKFYETQQEYQGLVQKQTEMISREFQNMPNPRLWKPVDEFAQEKVSESVAQAAADSFKKYGKNSPLILLENVYPEFALSRADTLKDTIKDARKKFAKQLSQEKKLSEKEAMKQAEKLIGVTWDVGHIYMLKKSGYSDADIAEEAKKIAPYVKHIHLTDHFGFEDAHLPPGEGTVNIKEQLNEIQNSQGKKFGELRGIVEAGEFVANYKEVPHLYALSHLSSPMYSDSLGPYWSGAWDQFGAYGGGYGELLPQKYFDLYGSPSFSQLPAALGGSAGGSPDRGRFASSTGGGDEE